MHLRFKRSQFICGKQLSMSVSIVGAGRPQTRRPSSAKRRLRQVECRARVLQLRLKELSGQEEHYKAELQKLRQQEQQLTAADKPAKAAKPADAPVEQQQQGSVAVQQPVSVPQPDLKQEPAAEEAMLSSPRQQSTPAAGQHLLKASVSLGESLAGLRRSQRRRKHERLHAPDLAPAALLRHPMFAAMAGVCNPIKVSVGHLPCEPVLRS